MNKALLDWNIIELQIFYLFLKESYPITGIKLAYEAVHNIHVVSQRYLNGTFPA